MITLSVPPPNATFLDSSPWALLAVGALLGLVLLIAALGVVVLIRETFTTPPRHRATFPGQVPPYLPVHTPPRGTPTSGVHARTETLPAIRSGAAA